MNLSDCAYDRVGCNREPRREAESFATRNTSIGTLRHTDFGHLNRITHLDGVVSVGTTEPCNDEVTLGETWEGVPSVIACGTGAVVTIELAEIDAADAGVDEQLEAVEAR